MRTRALLAIGMVLLSCTKSEGPSSTSGAGGATGGSSGAGGGSGGGGGAGGGAAGSGGGTGTGGTTGAGGGTGGTVGGAGGGTAANPCTTALFCDDFESYTAGQAPGGSWRAQTNMGAVVIDGAQSRSGTKSAKFTTQARTTDGGKTAFIRLMGAPVFPVAGNVFYGRMMFRLESSPTTSVHWTFIQGGGLVAGQNYHALYRYGGQHPVMQGTTFVGNQLMANYETPDSYSGTGPSTDCWHHANRTVVPVGRWACVEWKFDGPANEMRMWLDGAALDDMTVTGRGDGCGGQAATFPWTAPAFDTLSIGWESYQADAARTLWIDDVVVSTTPIGCPAN